MGMGGMPGSMNLGAMMPGMPGMAGAGFPTPFGRMRDAANQGGGGDQMQMSGQMPPGLMDQLQNQMGAGMMEQSLGGMGAMGNANSGSFNPMMSNDKMVMAS